MFLPSQKSSIQKITYTPSKGNPVNLWIKREDLLHPYISGNKYRKLAYNLEAAKRQNYDTLLTFGGAYSNHIRATAAAGNELVFKTIGVIRGEELAKDLKKTLATNPSLAFAREKGMCLKFVSRKEYRLKHTESFLAALKSEFGTFYHIPEGGTNELAVIGCAEILGAEENIFKYICCPVGTGGTISGIIRSLQPHQKAMGFSALKGNFIEKEIRQWVHSTNNWQLINEYHFGGFAKITEKLIRFINDFKQQTNIPLDPIYTGKMLYGIVDLFTKKFFNEDDKVLAIHTGGTQSIEGMNRFLAAKNLSTIKINNND